MTNRIKPDDSICHENSDLPVVCPERRRKKTILVDKVSVIRIVCPGITDCYRIRNILAAYNNGIALDDSIGPDELLIFTGNGKMLQYLQEKTGATIFGFDYSEQAIESAKKLAVADSQFDVGVIGEIEYPEASFDVIVSMDSLYFAQDLHKFVAQVKEWLKDQGVFFVAYQEGDVTPKTTNAESSLLSKALKDNGFKYEVKDITRESYELLLKKRAIAFAYKARFDAEGNSEWGEMLISQTDYADKSFEQFAKEMARYIFIAHKEKKDTNSFEKVSLIFTCIP